MKDVFERLKKQGYLLLDGSMGSLIIAKGIEPAKVSSVNMLYPDTLCDIYAKYINAGCDIVTSNTFGVGIDAESASGFTKKELVSSAVTLLLKTISESTRPDTVSALDIGPFGGLLAPFGTVTYEQAKEHYKEIISYAEDKTDILLMETFADIQDLSAAIEAAEQASSKPIFASMAFAKNKRTYMGARLEDLAKLAKETSIAAVGLNCCLTPEEMLPVIFEFKDMVDIPVFAQPNMGNPVQKDGKTVYEMDKNEFAEGVSRIYEHGIRIVGGCCGSDDECIKLIYEKIKKA